MSKAILSFFEIGIVSKESTLSTTECNESFMIADVSIDINDVVSTSISAEFIIAEISAYCVFFKLKTSSKLVYNFNNFFFLHEGKKMNFFLRLKMRKWKENTQKEWKVSQKE